MLHGNGGCNRIDSTIFDTEASDMSKQQRGFTLIELIVVIVILGILAATALPRFVNLQSDARAASMKGMAGSMRASVELIRGKWLVAGSSTDTTVDLADGTTVDVAVLPATASGVPLATTNGILRAAGISTTDYTCTGTAPMSCTPVGGPPACIVTYEPTTGVVVDTAAIAANC